MAFCRLGLVALCCWVGCGQEDVQDTIEGIMGLMQRFEGLQPRLNMLPQAALQEVSRDGQGLHRRFLLLQQAAGTGTPDQNELVTFQRDLAGFVGRVEGILGVHGPPETQAYGSLAGNLAQGRQQNSAATPQFGGTTAMPSGEITPATDRRLQAAMSRIMQAMQRFEGLQQRLSSLPPQRVNGIATRANTLDMEFRALQSLGSELAGDGSAPLRERDAVPFTERLEAMGASLEALIRDTEEELRQPGGGQAGRGFGLGMPASPVAATSFPQSHVAGSQNELLRGMGSGGSVTPATDARMSAAINKVMAQMQAFEAIKPKTEGLPTAVFMRVAKQAESHDSRFRALQRRGEVLVGDASKPMAEADALAYVEDLEKFHFDQETFVRETESAIEASGHAGGAQRQFPTLQPSGRQVPVLPRGLTSEKLPPLPLKPPPRGAPKTATAEALAEHTTGSNTPSASASKVAANVQPGVPSGVPASGGKNVPEEVAELGLALEAMLHVKCNTRLLSGHDGISSALLRPLDRVVQSSGEMDNLEIKKNNESVPGTSIEEHDSGTVDEIDAPTESQAGLELSMNPESLSDSKQRSEEEGTNKTLLAKTPGVTTDIAATPEHVARNAGGIVKLDPPDVPCTSNCENTSGLSTAVAEAEPEQSSVAHSNESQTMTANDLKGSGERQDAKMDFEPSQSSLGHESSFRSEEQRNEGEPTSPEHQQAESHFESLHTWAQADMEQDGRQDPGTTSTSESAGRTTNQESEERHVDQSAMLDVDDAPNQSKSPHQSTLNSSPDAVQNSEGEQSEPTLAETIAHGNDTAGERRTTQATVDGDAFAASSASQDALSSKGSVDNARKVHTMPEAGSKQPQPKQQKRKAAKKRTRKG